LKFPKIKLTDSKNGEKNPERKGQNARKYTRLIRGGESRP